MDKNLRLKKFIREEIKSILIEESSSQPELVVGKEVTIPKDLTTDPINKQGKTGIIKHINWDLGVVAIIFDDDSIGIYKENVFTGGLEEASKEQVENQKEFNKELEKTEKIVKSIKKPVKEEDDDSWGEDDMGDWEDKEPTQTALKKDKTSVIATKLQTLSSKMKILARQYHSESDETRKEKIKDQLKSMTREKRDLEKLL